MPHPSSTDLLVTHTLRVLGHATPAQVAGLRALPPDVVLEVLDDGRAAGLVSRSSFGGSTSWHLTETVRVKGESDLAVELDGVGGRATVERAHEEFLPLNRRIGDLMTQWQLRPTASDPLAPNDHRDAAYDDAVVRRLRRLAEDLRPVTDRLTSVLQRFDLHQPRVETALRHIEASSNAWVDAPDVASLNIVWIQLHEDLLASLGIERGQDDPGVS